MRGNFTRKVRGIIAILLLMVLSACSKYFVSTATDDNLPEADIIANAKVETALEKYVNFNLNGEKGTLVQFGIETGIEYEKEEQYTPLLASGILINTPKIEEKFPSKVELVVKETIATNGNNNSQEPNLIYNSQTGEIRIITFNTISVDGSYYKEYKQNAKDKYSIILTYPEEAYNSENKERELQITGTAIELIANKAQTRVSEDFEHKNTVTQNVGNLISTKTTGEEIYNGYIKANKVYGTNYSTDYEQNVEIDISKTEIAEETQIDFENIFADDKENTTAANELIYTSTTLNKQEILNVLGEEGSLKILDEEGNTLGELNKNTEVDENGLYKIKYEKEINKLKIIISKAQKVGTIKITNAKQIKQVDLSIKSVEETRKIRAINKIEEKVKKENSEELETKITEKEIYNYEEKIKTPIQEAKTSIKLTPSILDWTNEKQNEVNFEIELQNNEEKYNLFKNTSFEIKLPEEVGKVILDNSSIIHGNGLELANVSYNEETKTIKVETYGEQKTYIPQNFSEGTKITIPAIIILNNDIEEKQIDLKLEYKNENTLDGITETGELSQKITLHNFKQELQPEEFTPSLLQTSEDNIIATGIEQQTAEGISLTVKPIRGDVELKDGDTVYEGEFIKYEITATNTTNEDIDNVKVVAELPEGVTYAENVSDYTQYDVESYYNYDENLRTKEIELGKIEAGKSINTFFEVKVKDINERLNYLREKKELLKEINEKYEKILNEHKVIVDGKEIIQLENEKQFNLSDFITEEEFNKLLEYNMIQSGNINYKMWSTHKYLELEAIEGSDSTKYIDGEEDENGNIQKIYRGKITVKKNETAIIFSQEEIQELSNLEEIGELQEKEIYTQLKTYIKNDLCNNYRIRHNLEQAEYQVSLSSSLFKTNEYRYTFRITGKKSTSEEIPIELKLPECLKTDYSALGYVFKDHILKFTGKTDHDYSILATQEKTPTEINEAIVTIDSKYKSNQNIIPMEGKSVKVTIESENEGEKVNYGDEIIYNISVTNTGKKINEDPAKSKITANINGNISEYVDIKSISYNKYKIDANTGEITEETDTSGNSKLDLTLDIPYQKTVNIKVTTKAKLYTEEKKVVTNVTVSEPVVKITIAGEEKEFKPTFEPKTSREITHTILPYVEEETIIPDEPENPENPDEPVNPINPDNPDQENKYSLSGIVWNDENGDGIKQETEKQIPAVETYLLNSEGIVKSKTLTGLNGEDKFEELAKGNYIIAFKYDSNKYSITQYNAKGEINSKAQSQILKIENKEITAGVTDILTIQKDLENINLGLIENKKFDFKVENYISKITVKTANSTEETTYNNVNLAKKEIRAKEIEGAVLTAEFKIKITNNGEIAGTIGKVVDKLPEGFTIKDTSNWVKDTNGNLINTSLNNKEIKSGESTELSLIATINLTENKTGTYSNKVVIEDVSNTQNLEEISKQNNTSNSEIIISISTGIFVYIFAIGGILAIVILFGIKFKQLGNISLKLFSICMVIVSTLMIANNSKATNWELSFDEDATSWQTLNLGLVNNVWRNYTKVTYGLDPTITKGVQVYSNSSFNGFIEGVTGAMNLNKSKSLALLAYLKEDSTDVDYYKLVELYSSEYDNIANNDYAPEVSYDQANIWRTSPDYWMGKGGGSLPYMDSIVSSKCYDLKLIEIPFSVGKELESVFGGLKSDIISYFANYTTEYYTIYRANWKVGEHGERYPDGIEESYCGSKRTDYKRFKISNNYIPTNSYTLDSFISAPETKRIFEVWDGTKYSDKEENLCISPGDSAGSNSSHGGYDGTEDLMTPVYYFDNQGNYQTGDTYWKAYEPHEYHVDVSGTFEDCFIEDKYHDFQDLTSTKGNLWKDVIGDNPYVIENSEIEIYDATNSSDASEENKIKSYTSATNEVPAIKTRRDEAEITNEEENSSSSVKRIKI